MNVVLHCLLVIFVICVSVAATVLRDELSDRAGVGLLVAAIAAVFLAVSTEPMDRNGQRAWDDVRVSATSRSP